MRNASVALAINSFLGGPAVPLAENIAAGRWTRGEVDTPTRATRRCKVDILLTAISQLFLLIYICSGSVSARIFKPLASWS
jgi:hypothetical protein